MFRAGEGAVGRALVDPRGFDLCSHVGALNETTFSRQKEAATDCINHVVCCRVKGGVVELGTSGMLCPRHISGACPCAASMATMPNLQRPRHSDPIGYRSPLRRSSGSAILREETERLNTELERAKFKSTMDSLIDIFDEMWFGGSETLQLEASPTSAPEQSQPQQRPPRPHRQLSSDDIAQIGTGTGAAPTTPRHRSEGASSSRAVPPSRSPSAPSASPRLFCVTAQSSGTRSCVHSCSAAR